jgi:NDP-sugar pyrophosphorylase family protein
LKLFLKESNYPFFSIDWVEEEGFLGTAGSLSLLKDKIDGTFFVTNCDSILEIDLRKALQWHKDHDAAVTIIGCHNEVRIPFGVLELSDGKVERILEKPVHDIIINAGVYIMEPHILSRIPYGVPLDMDVLIRDVIEKDKISAYVIYDGWFDIGRWDDYRRTLRKIEKGIEDV